MIGVMFQSCEKASVNQDVNTEVPENGIVFVDLGLPSGTKWAACNYGATSPTQGGSFLSFGEIPDGTPTQSEWEELKKYCLITSNGDGSVKIANRYTYDRENDFIILPSYGGYYRDGVYYDSDFAKYWSSSIVLGQHYVVTANKSGFSGQEEPYDFKCFVRQVQRPQ